jgi:hypothetical protein
MTKNSNDFKTILAEASARYLLGRLEETIPNSDGGLIALVRPALGQDVHFLVEISRWGKLVGLTRVKGAALTPYESNSVRFTLLAELLKAERARAVVRYERQVREDFLKGLGGAGTTASAAGRNALRFGRGAFDRISKEARPTLERVYQEARPTVEKVYQGARPTVERIYGEVKPAAAKVYGEARPAFDRAYDGAKRWLAEGIEPRNSLLVSLFSDGFVVVQNGDNPEDGSIEGFAESDAYIVTSESGSAVPVEIEVEWSDEDGYSVRTDFGYLYPEVPEGSKLLILISAEGFSTRLVDEDSQSTEV